jgi:hypothetical protein
MFQDPFADLIPNQPAQPGVPQMVVPPRPRQATPQTPQEQQATELRSVRTEQEIAAHPVSVEGTQLANEDRRRQLRREAAGTTLPREAIDELSKLRTAFSGFNSSVGGFMPDYSGPGSTLENTAQEWLGTGTPGQRDWWSNFYANDMQLRNVMFGASLTPSEQASWERATIHPGMTADEIRRNLNRRREMAMGAMRRRAEAFVANGWNADAVRATLGEFQGLLEGQDIPPPPNPINGLAVEAGIAQAQRVTAGAGGPSHPGEGVPANPAIAPPSGIVQGQGGTPIVGDTLTDEERAVIIEASQTASSPEEFRRMVQERTGLDVPNYRELFDSRGNRRPVNSNFQLQTPDITDARGGDAAADEAAMMQALLSSGPGGAVFGTVRAIGGDESAMAFGRGVADTGTFGLADEIVAGGTTLFGGGTYDHNLARERAINAYDYENNFGARLGGQFLGGAAMPFPAARTGEALSALARYAPQMRAGAAYSAGYGFGSGDGNVATRGANALLMGAAGAAAPPVLGGIINAGGRAVNALRGTSARAVGQPNEQIIQAFQEEGVDFARPFADPTRHRQMRVLEATQGGNDAVTGSVEATRAGLQGRVAQMGATGSRQTADEMGSTIRGAVERRVEAQRTRARTFYERAERESAGAAIEPRELVRTLDASIANLRRNPNTNKATLSELLQVRADLVDDAGNIIPKTVQDIQNIREGIAGGVNQATLRTSRSERILNAALHAGKRDVERDLGRQAPGALTLYRQGDEIWAGMHRDSHQLLERLTGPADNPISGEQVLARVRTMMSNQGDARRYQRVLRTLAPAEHRDYVATLTDTIGRRSADEDFSPALFVSQTKDWSDEALRTTFGREGARSITNLRTASQAFRDTTGNPNNVRSGLGVQATLGGVVNFRSIVGNALGMAAGAVTGGPTGAAVGSALGHAVGMGLERRANRLSAQALMNPDISRWLGRAARAESREQSQTLTRRLSGIAQRNPAFAAELEPLINSLVAANDNVVGYSGRAAASGDERRNQQERP